MSICYLWVKINLSLSEETPLNWGEGYVALLVSLYLEEGTRQWLLHTNE